MSGEYGSFQNPELVTQAEGHRQLGAENTPDSDCSCRRLPFAYLNTLVCLLIQVPAPLAFLLHQNGHVALSLRHAFSLGAYRFQNTPTRRF